MLNKTNKKVVKTTKKKNNIVVSFKNMTKAFGTNVANDNINFDVYENEVHALLGENGAGKSTLMSILFGLYTPTSGHIEIHGEKIEIKDPSHANELKIAMLPQHFKLIDNMSVVQNVVLGYEKINKSKGTNIEVLSKLAKKFKIDIDLKAKVSSLSLSDKQKVEILKILWRDAEIIIFDEPTSILTQVEIEKFLKMVLYMKSIGKTIFIITHKLPEIKAVADRVTIIRKGKYISTEIVAKTSELQLAKLMVGKEVNLNLSDIKRNVIPEKAEVVLKINNLVYESSGYDCNLDNINLEIKKGEILGIAAIDGNGQSELIKSIAGIIKSEGEIIVHGVDISTKNIKNRYFNFEQLSDITPEEKQSYKDAIVFNKEQIKNAKLKIKNVHEQKSKSSDIIISKNKQIIETMKIQIQHIEILANKPKTILSHIPEDRHLYGMFLDYSVAKNAVIQDIEFYTKFGFINYRDINSRLNYFVDKYDIRGVTSNKILARKLSGGNQQKLILAREIERNPKLLLAAHPTRGLDVGAIRNVYESIIKARNNGMSVILNSGELEEIMQVSDRIIVMYDGKIVSESKRGELSKVKLGSLMAGGK